MQITQIILVHFTYKLSGFFSTHDLTVSTSTKLPLEKVKIPKGIQPQPFCRKLSQLKNIKSHVLTTPITRTSLIEVSLWKSSLCPKRMWDRWQHGSHQQKGLQTVPQHAFASHQSPLKVDVSSPLSHKNIHANLGKIHNHRESPRQRYSVFIKHTTRLCPKKCLRLRPSHKECCRCKISS